MMAYQTIENGHENLVSWPRCETRSAAVAAIRAFMGFPTTYDVDDGADTATLTYNGVLTYVISPARPYDATFDAACKAFATEAARRLDEREDNRWTLA